MKTTIIVLLTLFAFTTFSQNLQNADSTKIKKWKVNSYGLNMKPMIISNSSSDFNDLKNRLNSFEVPSDYQSKEYTLLASDVVLSDFNIELGISAKSNREFLVGISYISGNRNWFDLSKKTAKRIDTVELQGKSFYADSFTFSNYGYSEYVDDLGLVLAYIFKSDQTKQLSVFGGLGINVSYSFTSLLSSQSLHDSILRLSRDENPSEYFQNYKSGFVLAHTSEGGGTKTNPNFFIRTYIPFGINWNISKTDDFWKHINILLLAQFGMEYRRISSDLNYFKPYWGIGGMGFKYTF